MKSIVDPNWLDESEPNRDVINSIIHAALDAADPTRAVEKNLTLVDGSIHVGSREYVLMPASRIILISLGKAAPAMLAGASDRLGDRVTRGVCVCKHTQAVLQNLDDRYRMVIGNHPVPGEGSLLGGREIREAVSGLNSEDLVILLLSGGGSSLAVMPAEGIDLGDLQELTDVLLRSGASINEINTVRKHLDLLKGGGLLKLSSPARIASLILSDVVGSPLDVIASGPTVPDPTTFVQTDKIVKRASQFGVVPFQILQYLQKGIAGEIPETLKPGDSIARDLHNVLIGSNVVSCTAAADAARILGLQAEVVTTELTGEARLAGEYLGDQAILHRKASRPFLKVYGGETTVSIKGGGKGGRNLEVALASAEKISGLEGIVLVTLATDGEDGPTQAAGAVVNGETYKKALSMGLDADEFLNRNDSYSYFEKVGGLLITGATGTNVNDINFIFGF